jgi:hypothetical protein
VGQKSRWKGSELRKLSSPQMNQTLTARRSWQLRAQLAKISFSKYQQMLHKASEIF